MDSKIEKKLGNAPTQAILLSCSHLKALLAKNTKHHIGICSYGYVHTLDFSSKKKNLIRILGRSLR